jgi:tryptophanyl-tRNA synthetase
VFALYQLFATPDERSALAEQYRNPMLNADARKGRAFGYGDAKKMLLAKIDAYFAPAREKRKQLAADPVYVERVLRAGAVKARAEARQTMELVRAAVGLQPKPVS